MITLEKFESIGKQILTNPSMLFKMVEYKSALQNEIIPMLTSNEVNDIANSIENKCVISKLAHLASIKYKQLPSDTTLYCLSLSIGTILKEYEWGNSYVTTTGCYELAKKLNI